MSRGLPGSGVGGAFNKSRVSTKRAEFTGADWDSGRLRSYRAGLRLCGNAHPCRLRNLVGIIGGLVLSGFLAHIISAVNGHHLLEPLIFCVIFEYLGELESRIFSLSVVLTVRLLRDLLDDDAWYGEDDKLVAGHYLV